MIIPVILFSVILELVCHMAIQRLCFGLCMYTILIVYVFVLADSQDDLFWWQPMKPAEPIMILWLLRGQV